MKKDLSNVKNYREKNNSKLDKWVTTHLSAFIFKNPDQKDHNEITHILDFLKSEKAPKRITRLGYEDAKILADKWLDFLSKNKNINELEIIEKDIKLIKSYDNGYKWVALESEESYKREGVKMGHCVATYYRKPSAIYSLRDEKNHPHCTVEIVQKKNKGRMSVTQIRGKQNKAPILKYVEYIRDMFMKKIEGVWVEDQYQIERYEMKNLYFYQNGKEYIDLCNLPKSIILYDTLESYVLDTLGQAILQCDNVVFKQHVEMPIELFAKRKNWIFEKTLTILNSKVDDAFELDMSGLNHVQIKNQVYYYGENTKKTKVKKKVISLNNINAKLFQISGDNFKIINDANIEILEIDAKTIDFNNVKINSSLISFWNKDIKIKNDTNLNSLLVEAN